MASDQAEQTLDDAIESIITNEKALESTLKTLKADNKVSAFFSNDEIEMIVGHELKKELDYGNASEH